MGIVDNSQPEGQSFELTPFFLLKRDDTISTKLLLIGPFHLDWDLPLASCDIGLERRMDDIVVVESSFWFEAVS